MVLTKSYAKIWLRPEGERESEAHRARRSGPEGGYPCGNGVCLRLPRGTVLVIYLLDASNVVNVGS